LRRGPPARLPSHLMPLAPGRPSAGRLARGARFAPSASIPAGGTNRHSIGSFRGGARTQTETPRACADRG
jgi:hypothetical protein